MLLVMGLTTPTLDHTVLISSPASTSLPFARPIPALVMAPIAARARPLGTFSHMPAHSSLRSRRGIMKLLSLSRWFSSS